MPFDVAVLGTISNTFLLDIKNLGDDARRNWLQHDISRRDVAVWKSDVCDVLSVSHVDDNYRDEPFGELLALQILMIYNHTACTRCIQFALYIDTVLLA